MSNHLEKNMVMMGAYQQCISADEAPLEKGRAPPEKGRAPLEKGRVPLEKGRAPPEKGKEKRMQHCSLCRNHGKTVPKRGHTNCPYKSCTCLLCQLVREGQRIMKM